MTTLEWLQKNTLALCEESDYVDRGALAKMFPSWPEDVKSERVCHINQPGTARGEVRGLGMTLKPKRCISYGDTAVGVTYARKHG